jgi:hypothetical protein
MQKLHVLPDEAVRNVYVRGGHQTLTDSFFSALDSFSLWEDFFSFSAFADSPPDLLPDWPSDFDSAFSPDFSPDFACDFSPDFSADFSPPDDAPDDAPDDPPEDEPDDESELAADDDGVGFSESIPRVLSPLG